MSLLDEMKARAAARRAAQSPEERAAHERGLARTARVVELRFDARAGWPVIAAQAAAGGGRFAVVSAGPSYADWCVAVCTASGRHGTTIRFGADTFASWDGGESADDYANRQPLSRLCLPLGDPARTAVA